VWSVALDTLVLFVEYNMNKMRFKNEQDVKKKYNEEKIEEKCNVQ